MEWVTQFFAGPSIVLDGFAWGVLAVAIILIIAGAWDGDAIWRAIARFVARPRVAQWIIDRAMRTPYRHIASADGAEVYMERYWLINPYDRHRAWWRYLLPSIRVHHIMRPDQDRHLHDHPWNARTLILDGYYVEEREDDSTAVRMAGDTARIKYGEYHRIKRVSPGGVWTLFVTWRYRGAWGFLVDGRKVPYYDYLGDEQ